MQGELPEPTQRAEWLRLHQKNIDAHTAGVAAARAKAPAANPHPVGTDERYWWREGYHGRKFTPLTTEQILVRMCATSAGGTNTPDRSERSPLGPA